jgi:hypothetical protein
MRKLKGRPLCPVMAVRNVECRGAAIVAPITGLQITSVKGVIEPRRGLYLTVFSIAFPFRTFSETCVTVLKLFKAWLYSAGPTYGCCVTRVTLTCKIPRFFILAGIS